MEQYVPLLRNTILFQEIEPSKIISLLNCLAAYTKQFSKNEFIYLAGETVSAVGLILTGTILISKEDFWGNRYIISEASPGSLFAETYACLPNEPLAINVQATTTCKILFLDVHKIITVCSATCSFHSQLINNLLTEIAKKNFQLTRKMDHISQKTTRSKLLSYLSSLSQKSNSASFQIPYNRQQLADYLSVDRSAMCNELSKLQREGILDFNKNSFTLHNDSFGSC